jgi:hypothetical protein
LFSRIFAVCSEHVVGNDGRRKNVGKVAMGLSMSLDGFIAGPNDGPERPLGDGGERLFAWYSSGDTEYRLPGTEMVFMVSPRSAELLREVDRTMGAFVTGRRTFTFVTDGVESAVEKAKEAAGEKDVAVGAASIVQQCIRAGLLDEVHINLVPVLLGGGVRLFEHLGGTPIDLESTRVIEAPGVTHLTFRVVR